MRFSHILVAYFFMASVMWAGGAIAWQEAGVAQLFVETPGDGADVNEQTQDDLESMNGPILEAAGSLAGGLIAVWNVLIKFVAFLFWPITVLLSVNAPVRVTVVLGGGITAAFFGAFIRTVRTSA